MKPERASVSLLGVTRSKAKMHEYDIPLKYHIDIPSDPAKLFPLTIGLLGDLAASINRGDSDIIPELQRNLRFSAYFFDSYFQSKLNQKLDPYLILVGAASYYLCDLPGSATVLANRDELRQNADLGYEGLESLLIWHLRGDQRFSPWRDINGRHGETINSIPPLVTLFLRRAMTKENYSVYPPDCEKPYTTAALLVNYCSGMLPALFYERKSKIPVVTVLSKFRRPGLAVFSVRWLFFSG